MKLEWRGWCAPVLVATPGCARGGKAVCCRGRFSPGARAIIRSSSRHSFDPGLDHAGVWIPPPFFFAGGWGAARLAELLQPLPLGEEPGLFWIGWSLITAAMLVVVLAFVEFARARTTIDPSRPCRVLIERGPFRFSRNPLYLCLAVVLAGVGLATRSGWTLVAVLPVIWVVRHRVIAPEERYLERRFGEQYREYCRRVNRWLGRGKPERRSGGLTEREDPVARVPEHPRALPQKPRK